jgi:hypothetical protein
LTMVDLMRMVFQPSKGSAQCQPFLFRNGHSIRVKLFYVQVVSPNILLFKLLCRHPIISNAGCQIKKQTPTPAVSATISDGWLGVYQDLWECPPVIWSRRS